VNHHHDILRNYCILGHKFLPLAFLSDILTEISAIASYKLRLRVTLPKKISLTTYHCCLNYVKNRQN